MTRKLRLGAALGAMASLMYSGAAQATTCWTPQAIAAAQARELHVMLMIVKLRCRAINAEIDASYDAFEVNQKPAIFSVEDELKAHYEVDNSVYGKADFSRFHTSLANFYGTGKTDSQHCAMFNLVTRELAKSTSDAKTMAALAGMMVPEPRLDSPRCAAPVRAKP